MSLLQPELILLHERISERWLIDYSSCVCVYTSRIHALPLALSWKRRRGEIVCSHYVHVTNVWAGMLERNVNILIFHLNYLRKIFHRVPSHCLGKMSFFTFIKEVNHKRFIKIVWRVPMIKTIPVKSPFGLICSILWEA